MIFSSSRLALLLAIGIAFVTTLCLALIQSIGVPGFLAAFVIVFALTYFGVYFLLEHVFFKEITRLGALMAKLRPPESPLNDPQSSVNPLKSINENITTFVNQTQKEIDELKKLEAFRREFIADVSHELKTPIFAAQGFVHTLLDGAVNDKSVRTKFLKKAARSLDGLDMLVQDLLTLSHIETGQIKMRFENIDLYKLTEEVFEQFEGKGDKKNVTLRIDGPRQQVMVFADWQRISQVMTNLISNAIKHSHDDSEVVVSFDLGKKSITTKIRDFGEGVPVEHQARIFERFYRVDKSRSREKGGTGLGLAIVKHILEGHKSTARVESVPGKGATFSFKLPRAKALE